MSTRRDVTVAVLALAAAGASCDVLAPKGAPEIGWRIELGREGGQWQGRPTATARGWVGLVGGRARTFDRATGRTVWETPLTTRPVSVAQNIAQAGDLLIIGEGGTVFALSEDTGDIRWRFIPSASVGLCEIAADPGRAYVGTRDHRVYALDASDGTARWSVDVGPAWPFLGVILGIARSADSLYVAASEWLTPNGERRRGHIIALDRATGTELWRFTGAGEWNTVSSTPRIVGNTLLAADLLSGFFAVDRFSGKEIWRVRTAAYAFGSSAAPTERDGMVYAAAFGGVYAVDLASGELRWKREDLFGASDAALCGDVLLIQNQTLQVLDPLSGASRASLLVDGVDFPTSNIIVDGDQAFVIGDVAAYSVTCPS